MLSDQTVSGKIPEPHPFGVIHHGGQPAAISAESDVIVQGRIIYRQGQGSIDPPTSGHRPETDKTSWACKGHAPIVRAESKRFALETANEFSRGKSTQQTRVPGKSP